MSYHARVRADPVCGQCGYCVRGITALTCPECGSDLREVGIIAPNMRLPMPRFAKGFLWTILLPIAATFISWLLLITILPFSVRHKASRDITARFPFVNTRVHIYGQERPWQPNIIRQVPFHPDSYLIVEDNIHSFLDVDLSTGAFEYFPSGGQVIRQSSGFSSAVVAKWLGTAGNPQAQAVSDAVYNAINEMHQGIGWQPAPILDKNGTQIGSASATIGWVVHDEAHPAVIISLMVFWLVVWIYGLRIIYRRRRFTALP